jgi:hypothetical protein
VKRSPINRGTALLKRTALKRSAKPLTRTQELVRRTPLKRAPFSPASPAQRAKIKGQRCVHCGRPATDPMHLWPRGKGGCDDPQCVVPGCRSCHRLFDAGALDVLADLVRDFKPEIAHAQLHTDPVSLLARLTGCEVVLVKPERRRIAMGDCAYTTVHAWPWLGERYLPKPARDMLAYHGVDGLDQGAGSRADVTHSADGSYRIFRLVDEEADYGTEAYRALITALHDAGLNVFAQNAAGGDYEAEWEFHPSGGAPIHRLTSDSMGQTVIRAGELLSACKRVAPDVNELSEVEDAIVGAAAKTLFEQPNVPEEILSWCP